MGRILSRGCRKGPIHFLVRQFLCSTWQPFLHPDLHIRIRRRAQKRSGMGRVSAHRRLVLEGFEHDGTLERVGMTTFEGSPRVVDELRPHACMRWARDPDHDAVMRIAAKLRGGGPILYHGIEAMRSCGTPPPRTVIGDPWGGPKPSGGVATRSVR